MSARDYKNLGRLLVIAVVGILCIVGLGFLGKAIILNGIILGVLTVAGIAILWLKAPKSIKRLLAKGDLAVDIMFTIAMFAAFGLTVTGLVGAGVTCIFMSILLRVNKFVEDKDNGKDKK